MSTDRQCHIDLQKFSGLGFFKNPGLFNRASSMISIIITSVTDSALCLSASAAMANTSLVVNLVHVCNVKMI